MSAIHKKMHQHLHHNHKQQRRLGLTILLNLGITLIQVIGGILTNSLALLSDAVHNLGDSLSLIMAFIARKIGSRAADKHQTFGYGRVEVLAAFLNVIILASITIYLFYEAILRFNNPEPVKSLLLSVFAAGGLIANVAGMLLLKQGKEESINIRAAYIHLLGDALSSLVVVAGGVLIYFTNALWIDPLLTLLIGVYILKESYPVAREAVGILMQRVPEDLDIDAIRQELKSVDGIRDIHHVHIWRLDDNQVHLEAHVDLDKDLAVSETEQIHEDAASKLSEIFKILHITLQMEYDFCDSKEVINQHKNISK